MPSSAPDKAKLFAEIISKNSYFDDLVSPYLFSSWTNLKLHNILATPKLVKKAISDLYFSEASGLDCSVKLWIWIFIHINWSFQYLFEGILFYILLESLMRSLYLRMLGRDLHLRNTGLFVLFLWLVKTLKNLQMLCLLITSRNVVFFLSSTIVSGLLFQ